MEQRIRLASGENNQIYVDLAYDDATMNAVAVIYANATSMQAEFRVARTTGNKAGKTFPLPANTVETRDETIPSFPVTLDARGRISGYSFTLTWGIA